MVDIAKIVKVVLSCCTVHEICLANQDDTVEFLEDGPEEVNNFQDISETFFHEHHKIF